MRHLRLEAMFHLLWALWHSKQFCNDKALFGISRLNLQQLPDVFGEIIESLDPTKFWDGAGEKMPETTGVDKLSIWNDNIDDYLKYEGERTSGLPAVTTISILTII